MRERLTLAGAAKVLIPRLAGGSTRLFAAGFRAFGIDAAPTPAGGARTRELGARHTAGDECDPLKVTVGDFLRGLEGEALPPDRVVLFLPTAEGPCRFGQYAPHLRRVLDRCGYGHTRIVSPSSRDGYEALGSLGRDFFRTQWRALVAADLLRKLLLLRRPYEREPGAADRAYEACLVRLERAIEAGPRRGRAQRDALMRALDACRAALVSVPTVDAGSRPWLGIVGEIFCRLNAFANDDVVRRLEAQGAECWMSDVCEWVLYTRRQQAADLGLRGRRLSREGIRAWLHTRAQRRDEHALGEVFQVEFRDRVEPALDEVMAAAEPYLPARAVAGEMVLNLGRAVCLARRGAAGIVDISPFTCMNGIVSEAIYPQVRRDHGGIPIRVFYFDGPRPELDQDLQVFLALARAYRERTSIADPACGAP